MTTESAPGSPAPRPTGRQPPHSEEAEKGVLGSILLDSFKVMDLCLERQIVPESFYLPAHRLIYEAMTDLAKQSSAIDVVTVTNRLSATGKLEAIGGSVVLDRLVDSTPTTAHAEYYIDIVRQKYLLRAVIACARDAEVACYESEESADLTLSKVEQSFMDITERQHGFVMPWKSAVDVAMKHIEQMLIGHKGLSGLSTGFLNMDRILHGFRPGEMIILAARPSMGKTSLAMNIAENIALGRGGDRVARPVGMFSLEMSHETLALRMLCAHALVDSHSISGGFVSKEEHAKITQAASVLSKAPIFLDDTGGLDVLELRARARRMKKKHAVELIVIDYLQLLHSSEFTRQGRQIETAHISGNLKAMAKELKIPVLVLSQLSRAPEQRDSGVPKLSDLRDSGAIEQDADVVMMLRRPNLYQEQQEGQGDELLAIADVVKHRNGPTGDVELNFEARYTRFSDRAHGVDGREPPAEAPGGDGEGAGPE